MDIRRRLGRMEIRPGFGVRLPEVLEAREVSKDCI